MHSLIQSKKKPRENLILKLKKAQNLVKPHNSKSYQQSLIFFGEKQGYTAFFVAVRLILQVKLFYRMAERRFAQIILALR